LAKDILANFDIRLVFFDLGGVLINVFLERFYEKISALIGRDALALLNDGQEIKQSYEAFERGLIEPKYFFERLRNHLHTSFDFDAFHAAYVNIFSLNEDVAEIAHGLSENVRLSIISNTDVFHYEYIRDSYPVMQLFEYPTTSYQAHSLKPEKEIYYHALLQVGLGAEQTLFIDDKPENIEAARSIGMHGIHFVGVAELRRELMNHGLLVP
jgi:HAD superfamily hydrolase (TIGR01549 family)